MCAAIYVDPAPSPENLAAMYGITYHEENYFKEDEVRSSTFELLEERAPSRALLDYGCGDGRFLAFAASRGWSCFGIEYDPHLVARLSALHPNIEFRTPEALEDAQLGCFGVIHLGDVFEHLVEPLELVRRLLRLLAPGGLLFVEGPLEANASLSRTFMQVYFRLAGPREASHPPTHLVLTDRANQLRALQSLGPLTTIRYDIFETPWPMPAERATLKGVRDYAKYGIGQLSVRVSKLLPGWGNRFVFVGSVPSANAP